MRQIIALMLSVFSGSLSAEVLTFECVPADPKKEGRDQHKFLVDIENKTWETTRPNGKRVVFGDVLVSGNAVTVEQNNSFHTEMWQLSRVDLSYTRTTFLNKTPHKKNNYEGQCKILKDAVERAF